MIRILGFHCRGLGSIPGLGTEILQVMWHGKEKKKKKGKEEEMQGNKHEAQELRISSRGAVQKAWDQVLS